MKKYSCKFIKVATVMMLSIGALSSPMANESDASVEELAQAELKYDIATFKANTKSLTELTDYSSIQMKHNIALMNIIENTYKAQQSLTTIISMVVLLLVVGGFVISIFQFTLDYQNKKSPTANTPRFTFKASKEGVEFSSSVIGLIVLFMSFFFFHLYVKDVYTIKISTSPNLQTNSSNTVVKK